MGSSRVYTKDVSIGTATILGGRMKVQFTPRGECVITLPADPGRPIEGIVRLTSQGELLLSCDTGISYIGPLVDVAMRGRLADAGEIRVNEHPPSGLPVVNHSYLAFLSEDFPLPDHRSWGA